MLAVVVTAQVQLSVPEFTVTHLLPYLLTIPLCGQWYVQRLKPEYWMCFSVCYYSTWLWIRISILSCGAILQDLYRPLIFSLPISGENLWQMNHSIAFTGGCNWTNLGLAECLLKSILINSNLPVTCWHSWSFKVVLTAPKTNNFDSIWLTNQNLFSLREAYQKVIVLCSLLQIGPTIRGLFFN